MTNTVSDASSNAIGTVSSKDGSFYSGDKKTNLSSLMMNLMVSRVKSVDGVLTGMINEMNDNNKQTKLMNDYLSGLRELRPSNSDGTVSFTKIKELQTKIGDESGEARLGTRVDVSRAWDLGFVYAPGYPGYKTKFTQSEIDQQIEVMKSKISSVNSNQQMAQIKLEKYNNVRNESMQMVSTIMKAAHQTLLSIINNLP